MNTPIELWMDRPWQLPEPLPLTAAELQARSDQYQRDVIAGARSEDDFAANIKEHNHG